MGSTKWTHRIERDFASNYLIFLKILFQSKNPLQRIDLMYQPTKELIWCTNYLNVHIHIFRKRWSFI